MVYGTVRYRAALYRGQASCCWPLLATVAIRLSLSGLFSTPNFLDHLRRRARPQLFTMKPSINPKKCSSPASQQSQSFSQKSRKRLTKDEDIRCVSYPFSSDGSGTITTQVISPEAKEMLLGRLREDLLSKLGGSWNRTHQLRSGGSEKQAAEEKVIRSRLVIGECDTLFVSLSLKVKAEDGR